MKSRGEPRDNNGTLYQAFAAFAKIDRARCLEKLDELQGPDRAAAVSGIGYAWSAQHTSAALTCVMQQPASERTGSDIQITGQKNDIVLMGFADWLSRAPEQARSWADSIPAGEIRDLLQGRIAQALVMRGDPAEAIRLLDRMGPAANSKMINDVAAAWARRDPQAAADWAIAQEPGPRQSAALAKVVGTWANDDKPTVENWLSQFPPGEARDRSVKAFLSRTSVYSSTQEQRIAEFD